MLLRLGFDGAALDARRLTAFALRLSDLEMATREGEPVDDAGAQRVAAALQRRVTGESVARIIGEREFYGLAFGLNTATLEPRPETEMLVDLGIAALPAGGRLLDLGTGTGAIAVAVLVHQADATAVATDLSGEALEAARGNAERHGVGNRIKFLQGSWFEPLTTSPFGGEVDPQGRVRGPFLDSVGGEDPLTRSKTVDLSPKGRGEVKFDLIVSNPPYIASAVVDTLAPEVRDFDPRLALDGGPDGLAPYLVIAGKAASYLKPGGRVLVEIGYDQGAAVLALFGAAGFADVAIHKDLAGLDRVVSAHHIARVKGTGR